MANLKAVLFIGCITTLAFLSSLAWQPSARASHPDSNYVYGATPFTGYWDRFGLSHPSVHPRSQCEPYTSGFYNTKPCGPGNWQYGPGDWALDFYAAPGTAVRTYNVPIPDGQPFQMKVWSVQSTCSAGASVGGYTVLVDLWLNGAWEGWIAYSHLDQVAVSPGQTIGYNTVLGYLKRWAYYAGCWEVTTDDGVHTHYEQYNKHAYACYYNYSTGQLLYYSAAALGIVGRLVYAGPQTRC